MVRRIRDDRTQRDYYAILGVPVAASQDEISRAYRRRARTTHPDVNTEDPGAELRFDELAAAREVLGDPTARAAYDELRNSRTEPGGRSDHDGPDVTTEPVRSGTSTIAVPAIQVVGQRSRPAGATVRFGPVVWKPTEVGRP